MFFFSTGIYSAQGLMVIYSLKGSKLMRAVGCSSVLLVAAYSTYELAFKLSFLVFGADYVKYFVSYEIYPTSVFAVSIATILVVREAFHIDRNFLVVFCLLLATWIVWLFSGSFPVNT